MKYRMADSEFVITPLRLNFTVNFYNLKSTTHT
jgi:hypothetical protein